MSEFARACLFGSVARVKQMLESAAQRQSSVADNNNGPLVALLEGRETSLRLSPLLMIVSAGKYVMCDKITDPNLSENQIKVAELLLSYGARPDARDVCGKTACHYGAGAMATEMTMAVAERASQAYKSSYLYGKQVELTGLENESMNGKRGIAGGYQWAANRRAVHLLDEDRQIAVKPKNIRLMAEEGTQKEDHVDNESALQKQRVLCNVQCRLGAVSLQEAIMSNRLDVAQFLIKLGADIDIADCDGISPRSMAMDCLAEMVSPIASYVKVLEVH